MNVIYHLTFHSYTPLSDIDFMLEFVKNPFIRYVLFCQLCSHSHFDGNEMYHHGRRQCDESSDQSLMVDPLS